MRKIITCLIAGCLSVAAILLGAASAQASFNRCANYNIASGGAEGQVCVVFDGNSGLGEFYEKVAVIETSGVTNAFYVNSYGSDAVTPPVNNGPIHYFGNIEPTMDAWHTFDPGPNQIQIAPGDNVIVQMDLHLNTCDYVLSLYFFRQNGKVGSYSGFTTC